jgi:uncharacterized damage-inducible protein DinB
MNLYGPKQLADSVRAVRKNTILIAEDIPEKDYGYRPTPESRSVAETLVHIALLSRADHILHEGERVSTLEGVNFGGLIKKSEAQQKQPRSKSEIIALLRTEGDRWCQWVEALPEAHLAEQVRQPGGGSKTRFEMLLGTKEHEMHHRGQLMVVERLLGIVPHLTRGRQTVQEAKASRDLRARLEEGRITYGGTDRVAHILACFPGRGGAGRSSPRRVIVVGHQRARSDVCLHRGRALHEDEARFGAHVAEPLSTSTTRDLCDGGAGISWRGGLVDSKIAVGGGVLLDCAPGRDVSANVKAARDE